jgi:hypothetical protein
MARKDRAPDPPRRPQAPQRRSTPVSATDAARRRRLLYVLAAAGVVALAAVLGAIFLLGGGDDSDVARTMREAGCTIQVVPAAVGNHTAAENATSDPKWNTNPPTSGPHYGIPAVYGEYDTPLKLAQVVHNLEHGAVYILYGPDVPDATVAELRDFYAEDRTAMLLAPLPSLGDEIALGAWTVPDDFKPGGSNGTAYLAKCKTFDEGAFSTFRDELRFKGPERFPPDRLQPGMS